MNTKGIFAAHAGKYGHLNWEIFPLAPGEKVPMKDTNGLKGASSNRAQIAVWRQQFPDANIALRCGSGSGVIVVDVDPRNGADETIARLAKEGKTFGETIEASTPSGGRHLYFAYDDRVTVSGANKLGRGLDISTNGHYVVLPPSYWKHAGRGYAWVRPPLGTEFPKLPRWVIDAVKPKPIVIVKRKPIDYSNMQGYQRQAAADLEATARRIAGLHDGRHEAPFKAGASLGAYVHHALLPEHYLEEAIMSACVSNGALTKYSASDLRKQIHNGLARARGDSLPPLARAHRYPDNQPQQGP